MMVMNVILAIAVLIVATESNSDTVVASKPYATFDITKMLRERSVEPIRRSISPFYGYRYSTHVFDVKDPFTEINTSCSPANYYCKDREFRLSDLYNFRNGE